MHLQLNFNIKTLKRLITNALKYLKMIWYVIGFK